jgi:hypothetical protein
MFQFLKVGMIGAGLQLVIVTFVTCLISLPALRALIIPATKRLPPDAELLFVYSPLKWLFFLVAVGIALTDSRLITFTAARIGYASRLMKPTVPDHAAKKLLALVGFTTFGLAILTLRPPPDFVIALSGWFQNSTTIYIMWSGLMSIGVANFGAITYAAWRAVKVFD